MMKFILCCVRISSSSIIESRMHLHELAAREEKRAEVEMIALVSFAGCLFAAGDKLEA